MPILPADATDLTTITLAELGKKDTFTQLATERQKYPGVTSLLQQKRTKVQAGWRVEFRAMTGTSSQARRRRVLDVDSPNYHEVMTSGQVDWRLYGTDYAVPQEFIDMNADPAGIVDIVLEQKIAGDTALMDLLEEDIWTAPAATTDLSFGGIPFWFQKASGTPSFQGGDPSGFTSGAAGIAVADVDNWKNWTGQYTDVSRSDLVKKIKEALDKTMFQPPVPTPEYGASNLSDYGLYTNYGPFDGLRTIAENQNDRLGTDLDSMNGVYRMRNIPVTWVPKLDDDTANPVYGINWTKTAFRFLRNWFFKKSPVMMAPWSHTTDVQYTDLIVTLICYDRRQGGWVLYV